MKGKKSWKLSLPRMRKKRKRSGSEDKVRPRRYANYRRHPIGPCCNVPKISSDRKQCELTFLSKQSSISFSDDLERFGSELTCNALPG